MVTLTEHGGRVPRGHGHRQYFGFHLREAQTLHCLSIMLLYDCLCRFFLSFGKAVDDAVNPTNGKTRSESVLSSWSRLMSGRASQFLLSSIIFLLDNLSSE